MTILKLMLFMTFSVRPNWHTISYKVHYSYSVKVVHYKGNREPFGMNPYW